MSSYDEETRRLTEYANNKLDPILKPLLDKLFADTPDDPTTYMLQYLQEKINKRKSKVSFNPQEEKKLSTLPTHPEEENPVDDVLFSFPKSRDERERIQKALKAQVLFAQLNEQQLRVIVNSMEKRFFKRGDKIIIQGEIGDFYYILDSGSAECYVSAAGSSGAPVMVKKFISGESFGELALMYNRPRAATIIAESDCVCWCLDRVTFRRTLLTEEGKKQRSYEVFLHQVPLLKSLSKYQIAKIADALEEKTYSDGEHVIRQGDIGDMFYIIVDGTAKVTKMFELGEEAKELMKLGTGKYFGELALIKDQPRNANVVADGSLRCVALNRSAFDRLLGDVVNELRERQTLYEKMEKDMSLKKKK